jgi:hypothetical protein
MQVGPLQVEPSAASVSAAPEVQPTISASPKVLQLHAGAQLEIELVDNLNSSTNRLADRFSIRLAEPISRDGVDVVAAGAMGQGEVIDVARAGIGGKQGKLIIAARYLDLNGQRVRVRGMTLMASGKSRVDLATGLALVVSPVAVFISGGDIAIPAGARATVRLAEDVSLPAGAPAELGGKVQ